MNSLQIQCFLAAINHGSFTKAAAELYITQSAFSKQIKKLEAEIGVSLFVRTNSKLLLTPAGEIVKTFAEQTKDAYCELIRQLSSFSAEEIINIGVLPLLADYKIFDAIFKFQVKADNVQINVREANQPEVVRELLARKIDFAILRLDYLPTEKFEVSHIVTDKFVFITTSKYMKMFAKKPYDLSKLETVPFILIGKDSDLYTHCRDVFSHFNFRPKKVLTTSRHLNMLSMVNSGAGVGVLPEKLVNRQMYPQLQIFDFICPEKTSLGLVTLRNTKMPQLSQRLFKYLLKAYENTELSC